MATSVRVTGTEGLRRTFDSLSPALIRALQVHIKDFADELQAWTITHYMVTPPGPLHQRSGNLIRALNVAPVETTGHTVSSGVGDNLEYAAVHEFGGTFDIPAYYRHVSIKVARALGYKGNGRVNSDALERGLVRAHTATYPKRAFLAPALEDKRQRFEDLMDQAAREAVEEAKANGSTGS